ncbi:hypothetical protein L1049_016718 [Liquidambar formosana]|uniref:Uncharacterized protein n=1 Tax=Liquidambar formosana TaxID=63359 RepID=A0AAP0S1W9_LIQFO
MVDPPEAVPSVESLDLETIRSQVRELTEIHRSCDDGVSALAPSDSENLLKDCALHLESRVNQLLSEYSDLDSLGTEDLDAYSEHLKGGLKQLEAENAKISNEIDVLNGTYMEDWNRLGSDLEGLKYSLDFIASQGLETAKVGARVDCSTYREDQLNLSNALGDDKFKISELNDQIEKNNLNLKSLQDLDCIFKRFEAIDKIEDAMTGVKVHDFEGNCIRLSLMTYIPSLEGLSCQQKIEDIIEPSELNHELLVEIMDETMELKNVEIFPNDVYIGDIIDAAKSFRQLFSHFSMLEIRSSLDWFVRKVQDRIILCTLRRYMVKGVNKSRHSFEYLDRDEMIVAHMVGGVDAFIKVPQGWPVLKSALKLISLKSSDHHSKGISLSFLCKVEEVSNSLDVCIRQNISSFVDAIEEILVQQMHKELQSDDTP